MTIVYRSIKIKDNLPLANLIRNIFIEHKAHNHTGTIFTDRTTDNLYELFQTPRSKCWVSIIDDKIIGCCGIFPTPGLPKNCAELVKFYLLREYRGRGIGKELLNKCVSSAVTLKYEKLYLESLPEFDKAVGMYVRYGFIHLDKPIGNSGHFGCNIWMEKRIS